MLGIVNYAKAEDFLLRTQTILEADEAANNLILGLCAGLIRSPEKITTPPYLTTMTDEAGKLLLVAFMTSPVQKLLLYSTEAEVNQAALEILARNLLEQQLPILSLLGSVVLAQTFAQIWASISGNRYHLGIHERIYKLTEVIPTSPVAGRLRPASEAELNLISGWIVGFGREALSEHTPSEEALYMARARIASNNLFVWETENKQVVTMAGTTRPTTNGIAVNSVYTPPELRGRGYASACVAALSQLMLDSGRQFCALFTDLANPTSNSIYQKMGYQAVCDVDEYLIKSEVQQ